MKAVSGILFALCLFMSVGCGSGDDPSQATEGAPPAPAPESSDYGAYQNSGRQGPPSAAPQQ